MIEERHGWARFTHAARRLLTGLSVLSCASAPLGVALAHERLKPALDEAARAGGALLETLGASAPRAHVLSLGDVQIPLTHAQSRLSPLRAAEELARSCGQHARGLGAAFGTDRGAVGACVTLGSNLSPFAQITFTRPREKASSLLALGSFDLRALANVLADPREASARFHGRDVPEPLGKLTLGAALDDRPLLALYTAPRAQLDELEERFDELGARTLRSGEGALHADFVGRKYLLIESTARGEIRLVVLRLPD